MDKEDLKEEHIFNNVKQIGKNSNNTNTRTIKSSSHKNEWRIVMINLIKTYILKNNNDAGTVAEGVTDIFKNANLLSSNK